MLPVAERLPDHHLVDTARHILEVVSLHHHRDAAGDLDILDGTTHLGLGFGESLAVFHRDGAGDFVEMLLEQHLHLEQGLNAVLGRSSAPLGAA